MPLLAASPRFTSLLRATRVALAAAATVTLAAGCGDGDDPLSPNGLAGSYALVSFNGNAVPYTVTGGGFRSELVSGALNLRADRTFDVTLSSRDTDLATGVVTAVDDTFSGRYAISGRVLTFSNTTDAELDGVTADVSGNTVTIGGRGGFTFRR